MYRVGLIADDLTGALDAAAPFAQHGLTTHVVSQLQALELASQITCEVLSVNTDSRHLSVDQATQSVSRACRFFSHHPPVIMYKKIDSTLRGNVAAEIVTTLVHSQRHQAIITPALPAQGRTVRNGEVYVNGIPLQKTAFMGDPVEAPVSRPLAEQLIEYCPDIVVSVGTKPPAWGADTMQVWIADCSEETELECIARLVLKQSASSVVVGSAGLAEALATVTCGQPRPPPAFRFTAGTVLYVVGSRAPASLAQAEHLATLPGCVLIEAPAGRIDTELALRTLGTRPDIALIQIPAVPTNRPLAVAAALGASVARLLEQITPAALIITGGDTAAAVLSALKQPLLKIIGELLPDIPISCIEHKDQSLPVITKAGGFGDDGVFLEIAAMIK